MKKEIKPTTSKEERLKLARQLRLKPKTVAFIEEMINNPKLSQGQAYMRTHKTNNIMSASATATNLLKTPNVMIYTASIENKAKKKIASLIDSDKEEIALRASQDILDRNIGKAVQKTVSTNLNITFEQALNDINLLQIDE
jgi:hypothetical protein